MSEETSIEVYNEESGKLEKRSPEQVRKSRYFYDLATKAEVIRWIAWKNFFDNEGHLDFGHTSKKSFIQTEFDDTVRTIERKIQAVTPFADLLPIAEQKMLSENGEATTLSLENDLSDEERENLKIVNEIGLSKWRLFSRDEHADFSKVLTDGVVRYNDGRDDISLEKVLDTTFRDLEQKFKAERKQYQKRIANLEEDKETYKSERDHFKSELEKQEDEKERTRELEAKYGPEASSDEHIRENLTKAEKALNDLEKYFSKVVVGTKEEDESLRQRVLTIIRSATYIDELACRRMPWLEDHKLRELPTFSTARVKDIKDRNQTNEEE